MEQVGFSQFQGLKQLICTPSADIEADLITPDCHPAQAREDKRRVLPGHLQRQKPACCVQGANQYPPLLA